MPPLKNLITNLLAKNANYRSETTEFISDLKRVHPELDAQQRAGRALLWDKNLDLALQADIQAGAIKQSAYVYQTKV